MPDHIHLLIRKHRDKAEQMILHLQERSRQKVAAQLGSQHSPEHPVWGGPGWKVFLDSRQDIQRTVRYVEQNPVKTGRPLQCWPFVDVYEGWLPGQVRNRKRRVNDVN